MQQTKYDELKGENKVVMEKVLAQHRLSQSSLVLLKNIDARLEAINDLSVKAGVYTEDEYQDAVDYRLGLRRKLESEEIEVGDIAWVSYKAYLEGIAEPQTETGFPVRIGSNAVMFESALIGKNIGLAKGIEFKSVFKEQTADPLKPIDRSVTFIIDVEKVKVRRKDGTDNNGILDDIDRADGFGGEGSDIAMLESGVQDQEYGHTDGSISESESV